MWKEDFDGERKVVVVLSMEDQIVNAKEEGRCWRSSKGLR